jgi:hypothetical protein
MKHNRENFVLQPLHFVKKPRFELYFEFIIYLSKTRSMKNIFYLISVALLLTFSSCKKNKCADTTCQNGGTCSDGTCQCPAGWTGANCETSTDPCTGVICYNNGNCISGTCSCPTHFSGTNCLTQETPAGMYIHRITVDAFNPADMTGTVWDAGSGPDIYPILKRNDSVIMNGVVWKKDDANYNTFYAFSSFDTIFFNDITNSTYRMELWDYDNGINDQFMDGFNFTPYTGVNGYPGSVNLTDTTFYHDKFEFRVQFDYMW